MALTVSVCVYIYIYIARLSLQNVTACVHVVAVAGEPGGVPGNGVHHDAGHVHRLRPAHLLPRDDGAELVRPGAVSSRTPLQPCRRLGRRPLGGPRHRAVLLAGGVPRRRDQLQLHAGGRRRRAAAQSRGVGAPRAVLVSRTHHHR